MEISGCVRSHIRCSFLQLVIAFGYVLAFIFLIMLLILCLRRYRTYEGWTKDHHATEDLKDQITRYIQVYLIHIHSDTP